MDDMTRDPGTPPSDAERPWLYWWMWPAWQMGRIRPGLRAATAADARRIRELPGYVGTILLPLIAIGVPAALSIVQAFTPTSIQGPIEEFAFVIYDVFTESIPFMLVGLAVGLASPAAGAILVLTYAVGNLAATIVTNELVPPLGAGFARLASDWLFWLLVVEIPLAGRFVAEWWNSRDDGPRFKRAVGVAVAALAVAGLTQMWTQIAPALISTVYLSTSIWGSNFLRGVRPPLDSGHFLVFGGGLLAVAILAVRYLGARARVGLEEAGVSPSSAVGRMAVQATGIALTLLLLWGLISQPIDLVILLAALVLAAPASQAVLRVIRIAPLLVRIAWPIRLLIGASISLVFAWTFIGLVGYSDVSRWFNTIIALSIGYLIIELFLAADDVVANGQLRTAPATTAAGIPTGLLSLVAAIVPAILLLAFPAVALAHGWENHPDIGNAAAAGAASGGAGAAAMMRRRSGKRPSWLKDYSGPGGHESKGPPKLNEFGRPGPPESNPPPWWMPDGAAEFFGYDAPPAPPPPPRPMPPMFGSR